MKKLDIVLDYGEEDYSEYFAEPAGEYFDW